MNKTYFWAMVILQILTLIIINWQYYAGGSEIAATFNLSRAVFILQLAIFGEFYRKKH